MFILLCTGAPQVLRYSVAKEVEAISGRDVRLEMEVCSDPVPSKTTWEWGQYSVEAGKVKYFYAAPCKNDFVSMQQMS